MNIGLIDVDTNSKAKKWGAKPFPNLALAKISRYHKQQGDLVEWYTPFTHYDVVYMSKVFNFTPDYSFAIPNACTIIRGGLVMMSIQGCPKRLTECNPTIQYILTSPRTMPMVFSQGDAQTDAHGV